MQKKKDLKVKVGISVGDLNGIGPEVILKTFSDPRIYEFCTPVVFGSTKVLSYYRKALGLKIDIFGITKFFQMAPGRLNVLNIWKEVINIQMGKPDPVIGKYAVDSFKRAVNALKEGHIDVLVTAPINKATVQSEDFDFPGHTDYLAQVLGGEALMMMISDEMKVALVTDHLPLRLVNTQITEDRIYRKARTLIESLKKDFHIEKPKIAVLGLNPHAGDRGLLGREDTDIILPAVNRLQEEGEYVFGPYAADGFFGSGAYSEFDGILAMYHDQGLIPFKMSSFGKGVNFTAGLPKIRTSPDHGTAYELTGKGIADESSFRQAVYAAIDIFKRRQESEQWEAERSHPSEPTAEDSVGSDSSPEEEAGENLSNDF
ncbi:MAG: 4-hydroxythreonine-4-phosphate dehydrogenase PdxA [Chlorobi bacterium]|nr:4-hydroxythreonine-4-phosphate dehydrogenase PdxA [Chlorobiota bacterium]